MRSDRLRDSDSTFSAADLNNIGRRSPKSTEGVDTLASSQNVFEHVGDAMPNISDHLLHVEVESISER